MHSISVCFGPQGTVWTLLFKEDARTQEVAETFEKALASPDARVGVSDDFGQYLQLRVNQIHGLLIEDLDISQLAQIERGLHQARSQAKAQTRAMEDPVIKESIRRQQMGPAVMSPVPGGRFNG